MVEFRTISGLNNNPNYLNWGKAEAKLRRILSTAYEDDGLPRGIVAGEPGNPFIGTSELPNPREISNAIANQTKSVTNYLNASDWIWQWGQFLDHDIDLNEGADEPFFIPVDPDDPLAKNLPKYSPDGNDQTQQLVLIEPGETELTLPLLDKIAQEEPISLSEVVSSSDFVPTDEFISDLESDFAATFSAEPSESQEEISEAGIPYIPFTRIPDAYESQPSRQYINEITSFIDGSGVYGSDEERAEFLRANDGTGKLKNQIIDDEELLPFNEAGSGLSNANPLGLEDDELFMAGDVRANEQVALTAAHTLFLREHNRLAEEIANRIERGDSAIIELLEESGLETGDFIYESARKVVGAEIQKITYEEYLPLLLGNSVLDEYSGYNSRLNPNISLEFANVGFRLGHSQLSPELQRVNPDGTIEESIALKDAFFDPQIIKDGGVNSLLLGLPTQVAQEVDNLVVDGVRNFLFGAGTGGFDLAAVNLQRGRDVGLPSYNDARRELGLAPATSFLTTNDEQGITSNPKVAARFASIYDSVEDVDFWIGGISEDPVNSGLVGELFSKVLTEQFKRLRDGDRFFYLNDTWDLAVLAPDLATTTLADIIQRNISGDIVIQDNVFLVPNLTVKADDSEHGADSINFTVSLSDVSGARVTVDYQTVDGLGVAGEDYVASRGALTFEPGDRTKTVAIDLLDDGVLQDNKTLFLHLSNPSNHNIDTGLAVSRPTVDREISGTRSDDVLNGSFLDEEIEGKKGKDLISGGLGDDVLEGNGGNDILNGEFDTSGSLRRSEVRNLLAFLKFGYRKNSFDKLQSLNPKNQTLLFGNDAAEVNSALNSSFADSKRNSISGDRGWGFDFFSSNDTQLGGNGNDILNGGFGSDTQLGGNGNDTLNGDFNFRSRFKKIGSSFFEFFNGNDVQIGGNGNDKLNGGSGKDKLVGVGNRLGEGEIDELTGGSDRDTFVLGDEENVFYVHQGDFDYALITDFRPRRDTIELHGAVSDYVLGSTPDHLPQGTGLYLDVDGSGDLTSDIDELIAVSTRKLTNFNRGFSFLLLAN